MRNDTNTVTDDILPGAASVASITNSAWRFTLAVVKPCPVSMILSRSGTGGGGFRGMSEGGATATAWPITGQPVTLTSFHRTLISYSPAQKNNKIVSK